MFKKKNIDFPSWTERGHADLGFHVCLQKERLLAEFILEQKKLLFI